MGAGLAFRRVAPWLVVGAFLVASCSSGSGDSADGTDGEGAPVATEADASGADPNGVLRASYDLALESAGGETRVDPTLATGDTQNNDALWYLVHGRLLRPTLDGGVEPELAESVEIADPNTIVVQVREGMTFSDGSPLDAAAVKASFDYVLGARATNQNGYNAEFFALKTVEVTGPGEVTLSFTDGLAPSWLDQYGAGFATSIVKPGDSTGTGAVSGPFRIVRREPGRLWVLEKNPNYWNAESIKFAGVELVHTDYGTAQSGLAALETGQVDITFTVPSLVPTLGGSIEPVSRISPNESAMLHICKSEGPLADARVRKAINKAIDREALSEAIYGGTAQPMHQSWPVGHRLNNPEVEDVLAYDLEGAKQLMQEAGYSDGGVKIDIYPVDINNLPDVAVVMKQQLAEIGIDLTIVPSPNYVAQFLEPDTPAIGLYPSFVSGPQKLTAWSGDTLGNVCDYSDPELDKLVAEVRQVSESSPEAEELWHEISAIVTEDALSGFLVFTSVLAAYDSDRIGDMVPFPFGGNILPDPHRSFIKADS
jgi:peptide/nickel transport system substrate-binding protein